MKNEDMPEIELLTKLNIALADDIKSGPIVVTRPQIRRPITGNPTIILKRFPTVLSRNQKSQIARWYTELNQLRFGNGIEIPITVYIFRTSRLKATFIWLVFDSLLKPAPMPSISIKTTHINMNQAYVLPPIIHQPFTKKPV